ncbi:phage tail family protein [Bacillus infantis]|uniref:phage tail family protein n=1 Tax=Bacillus infantis TaxID=324767 RepID=UPI00344C6B78
MIKTIDNFRILTKSGQVFDMAEDIGCLVRSLIISSPTPKIETETADGLNGAMRIEKTWGSRTIKVSCSIVASSAKEVSNQRNQLFRLFMAEEEFYLIADSEPHKRWLVEISNEWAPVPLGLYSEFELNFISHSPYAESTGTTLFPDSSDGVPQVRTDEPIQYVFQQPAFSIWNDSDVPVDPRERWAYLRVLFKGASENLTIKNLTTGNLFNYNGTSSAEDTIELNGIRSLKNGSSIFGQTNRQLLPLAPGRNEFEILGNSAHFEIYFDFRFLYI